MQSFVTIKDRWRQLSLAAQYLIAGSIVFACAMILIGLWVTRMIEQATITNTANATALYVDGVIAPLLPDLGNAATLDSGARRALDEVLSRGALKSRLMSFKIWRPGGVVLYATDAELIGKTFPPGKSLKSAWKGTVAAELDELDDPESTREAATGVPLLEIYSPIHAPWSGEVVAVSEFYENAVDFERNLKVTLLESWLVVAAVTAATLAVLSGIVLRGSNTIDRQRTALADKVEELSNLLDRNRKLQARVQRASRSVTANNERYLRRLGADLHDGPAQMLALAALRIDRDALVQPEMGEQERRREIGEIRDNLDEAMAEIRAICAGLVLPHIEGSELADIIETAIAAHEQRTRTQVARPGRRLAARLSQPEKIAIYRFLQEGLNNAFKHAGGKGQSVDCQLVQGVLRIEVADAGSGFDPANLSDERLGIAGLRDRIESIGGSFEVASSKQGTRIAILLQVEEQDSQA
ncbi:MAG: sensor histidine kinase [Hyphomicrobiales bacterium]|nr:sensor histidine kinase [Hyphomicrobiales bacterium]